jgi:hypothetical protein
LGAPKRLFSRQDEGGGASAIKCRVPCLVGMGKLRNPGLSGSVSLSFSWLSQTERRRRVLRGQGVGKCGPVWASVGKCGRAAGTDLTGCKMQIRVTLQMHFLDPMGNGSSAFQLAIRGCWALGHFLVSYPPIGAKRCAQCEATGQGSGFNGTFDRKNTWAISFVSATPISN